MRIETPNMQSHSGQAREKVREWEGEIERARERVREISVDSQMGTTSVHDPCMCFDMCLMPKTATCSEKSGAAKWRRYVLNQTKSWLCVSARMEVAPLPFGYSYVSDVFGRPAQMPDKLARRQKSPSPSDSKYGSLLWHGSNGSKNEARRIGKLGPSTNNREQ